MNRNNNSEPSLRYLLLHITDRCNLKCRHCYIGKPKNINLSFKKIKKILGEFAAIKGKHILISGGEPLLHPEFNKINKILLKYPFKKFLLTNGLLLDENVIKNLNFDEVQVSIDGLEEAHDALRGQGSFKKAFQALELLRKNNFKSSVATMVHKKNINDFPKLKKLLKKLMISEWNVDLPCIFGNLKENKIFCLSAKEAFKYLKYSYGKDGTAPPYGKYACGVHLMAIMADGRTDKCGYFLSPKSPRIEEGLSACFKKIPKIKLRELKGCFGCSYIEECRGGCRGRAKNLFDYDAVMCYVYKNTDGHR